jgi:type II secretory ATPase GspE/PulE/Tfp pilus assembly ATPase PilB-like protein
VLKPKNLKFMELLKAPPFNLTDEAMAAALEIEQEGSISFAELLAEESILPKEVVGRLWGDSVGVAYLDPFTTLVSREAIDRLPLEIARKAQALPLYILDGTLTIAMADPCDTVLKGRLAQIAQCPVSPVFSLPGEIRGGISIHYQNQQSLLQSLEEIQSLDLSLYSEMTVEDLRSLGESDALVQVVDAIIYYALRERASDIHIEPRELVSKLRLRVDGILREVLTFPRKVHPALISRLKVLSNLNIAETRFPQDGRFSMPIGTIKTDFRLSFIPSAFGEKVVARALGSSGRNVALKLDQMLISHTVLQPLKRLITQPNGIIFVTGPTGSGKTTTLYAAIEEIKDASINIVTIEDPIEVQVEGVTQCQVNRNIDLNFAVLLRAMLRQDPDVILVGEIRDVETAKIATEAALTGHLVMATLHTNSALQAITRMVEMGVEPYQVAPSIVGVLAQRLAARICHHCKEAYYPPLATLKRYFRDESVEEVPFYRGRGCSECNMTGYKGRVAFHELALVTEEMRVIIGRNGSLDELAKAARKVGYKPLRYDGLKKVLLGLTTIEEIEANSSFEWAC